MKIEQAIVEIRKRLDEIEALLVHLPASKPKSLLHEQSPTQIMTHAMRDWMDLQGVPKGNEKSKRIRKGLLRAAKLIEDGLTLEQIQEHRLIKNKPTLRPYLRDFYESYRNRR